MANMLATFLSLFSFYRKRLFVVGFLFWKTFIVYQKCKSLKISACMFCFGKLYKLLKTSL